MTMRQAKSQKDDLTPPRYAMSGFYHTIRISAWNAAAIDALHRTSSRWHDMAATDLKEAILVLMLINLVFQKEQTFSSQTTTQTAQA